MDFNRAFQAYDTLEGANCLTTGKKQSQKEAAIEAFGKVGLNQVADISPEWFVEDSIRTMFFKRLEVLKNEVQA